MATAEGVFPKIGNDPQYASEYNRFSPKLIGAVQQAVHANISGTAFQTLGATVDYPGAGSLQISEFMIADTVVGRTEDPTTANNEFRLRISGTAGLNIVTNTINISAGINFTWAHGIKHVYTSGALTASGGNVGSPYVISLEGKSDINSLSANYGDFIVFGY